MFLTGNLKGPWRYARYLVLVAALALVWACAPRKPVAEWPPAPVDYTLTILHTNDTHSNYGGTTDKGMSCYAALCEGGKGGYVRLDQAVRAVRGETPGALFLEAGDIFQGTLFWTQHKERMPKALVDRLGYQAMIPGNHEFDDGAETWLRLINSIKPQVLGANIHFSSDMKNRVKPYIVLEREGRKIGIIGVVTKEVPSLASPGPNLRFSDEKQALQKTVAELEAQGVKIIIALTHIGLEEDKRMAREIDGIDLYVGAHSHSLLANNPELRDRADGPYPVVEKTPNGAPVLVVSAYTACLYLGKIDLGFDSQGIVRDWQGEPISLDEATLKAMKAPAPNAEMVRLINSFAKPVNKLMSTTIGSIKADLAEGNPLEEPNVKLCRRVECRTGNIAADALRVVPFDDVQITLLNGGALRNSLPGGAITPGHVLGTLPFKNTPVKARMSGEMLVQALEHGVSSYGEDEGRFLQVSGLRYAFNPAKPAGSRVTRVEVAGKDGQWSPLDPGASYVVSTLDYIARGGDGFTLFDSLQWEEGDKLDNDVLRHFIEQHSPVEAKLEGRITVE